MQPRQWDAPSSSSSWQPLNDAFSSSGSSSGGSQFAGYGAGARSGEWDEEPLLFSPDLDTPPVVSPAVALRMDPVDSQPACCVCECAARLLSSYLPFQHMAPTSGSCAPRLTSHLRLLPVTSPAAGPGLAGLPRAAGGHGERADGTGSKHAGAPCPACPAVHAQSGWLVGQAYSPAFAFSLRPFRHASTRCHSLHLVIALYLSLPASPAARARGALGPRADAA